MKRRSLKLFAAAIAFLLLGFFCIEAAKARDEFTNFGILDTRLWNGWDFVWTISFALSAGCAVAGYVFLRNDD